MPPGSKTSPKRELEGLEDPCVHPERKKEASLRVKEETRAVPALTLTPLSTPAPPGQGRPSGTCEEGRAFR